MAILVPVGAHLFSTEQLTDLLNKTIPNIPENRAGAFVAGVDAKGTEVAIRVDKDFNAGHLEVRAAYEHEWSGDNVVGGDVLWAFGHR